MSHTVHRCEAKCSLDDFEEPRTALVLSPYFLSDVGSLDQIISLDGVESLRKDTVTCAWHSLVDSCISALAAGVASSDLQYLVDMQGHTLILDLTEARILRFASSSSSSSIVEGATSTSTLLARELELEQQLARSFLGELRSNMPTSLGESGQVYLSKVISEKLSNKPFFRFLFEE